MRRRLLLLLPFLMVLSCAVPLLAQTAPPQFKMVDVTSAVRKFNANTLVRRPATPSKVNFGLVFPKISVAAFPPRTTTPQLPSAFKVPPTTNPIGTSKFSFIKPK